EIKDAMRPAAAPGQDERRAEEANHLRVGGDQPPQAEGEEIRERRVEIVVSRPVEAQACLYHHQSVGKRPAALMELVTEDTNAMAALRKRAREAQDQPLRARQQLELREDEINSHGWPRGHARIHGSGGRRRQPTNARARYPSRRTPGASAAPRRPSGAGAP